MATLIRKRPLEMPPPPEGRSDFTGSQRHSSRRHAETSEYVSKRVKRQNSNKMRRVPSVRRRQLGAMSTQARGQLKILISRDKSDISINIIQARKLMSSDRRVCNPYVKVLLKNDDIKGKSSNYVWKKTKPVQNNRNPKFKEHFNFALRETSRNGRIILSVYNRIGTKNEFLGCMSFGIQSLLANHKEISGWYYLLDHDLGIRKHQPVAIQRTRSRLGSTSKMKPKFLTIERGDDGRYGFTLLDSLPVRVNVIVPGGPAEKVGLESNDLFLELNGFNVVGSSCKTIVELIAQAPGKLRLLVQPYADIKESLVTLSTQTVSVTPAISVRRLTVTPVPSCTVKQSTSVRKALQEVHLSSVLTDENGSQRPFIRPSSTIDQFCPGTSKPFPVTPSNSISSELHPVSLKPLPNTLSDSCFVKPYPVSKNSLPNKPSTSVHMLGNDADDLINMTSSLEDSFNPATDPQQTQNMQLNKASTSKHHRPMMQSSPFSEPTVYDSASCMSPGSVDGHGDSLLSDSSFISTSSLSDDSEVRDGSWYEGLLLEKLEVTGVAEVASVFSLPFFQRNSPVVPTPKPKPEIPKIPEKPNVPLKPQIQVKSTPMVPEKPNTLENAKPKIPEKPKHLVKQHSARIVCDKDVEKPSMQQEKDPWQKISTIPLDTLPVKRKRNKIGENIIPESKKICHSTDDPLMTSNIKQTEKCIPFNENPYKVSVDSDVKPMLNEGTDGRGLQSSANSDESLLSDSAITVHCRSLSKSVEENEAVYIVDMVCDMEKDKDDSKGLLSQQEPSVSKDRDDSEMSGELAKNNGQSTKQTIMLGGIKREVIFNKKIEPFIVDIPGRDFIHAGKLFLRKKVNTIQEVFGILFSDMLIFTKQVLSNKIKVLQPPVKFSDVSVMEFITKRATEFHIFMVTSSHPATLKSNKIVLGAPTSRLKKVWQFLLQQYVLEFKVSSLKSNGVQHLHTDIEIDGAAMESNNNRAALSHPQLMIPSSSKTNNGGILTNTSTTDMVHTPETTNESGTHSNRLSSTNCCEWDSATQVNQSSPALRSNRSFPYLRNAVVSSAPSSPINKVTTISHTLLERQQSSPTNMMLMEEKKGKRKTSIFKRFSGKNKDEVSGKGSKEKASKKDSKEKKTTNHTASRRAMSVGDERMLHGVENNIPTLDEGEELAGQSFQRHSVTDKPVRKSSRNLAKDLKDKVRSLRRRHTDSALRDAEKLKPPLPPCTLSEVRQWSESFDRLLRDKCGLEAFRRFLQTEFSDENIEFWLACEEYRTLSPSKHTNRARKIHEDYVATQAPREVNLDSATRIETTSNARKPDEHTFDNAQKRIEALMEKDSYPRFLKSDIYQQLLRTSKKSEC